MSRDGVHRHVGHGGTGGSLSEHKRDRCGRFDSNGGRAALQWTRLFRHASMALFVVLAVERYGNAAHDYTLAVLLALCARRAVPQTTQLYGDKSPRDKLQYWLRTQPENQWTVCHVLSRRSDAHPDSRFNATNRSSVP